MKYLVTVIRTGYCSADFEVEADSAENAKDAAIELAGDYQFSEHAVDYEANIQSR